VAASQPPDLLSSAFPVVDVAMAAIGASLGAAAELQAVRTGDAPASVRVDAEHAASAIVSDRHVVLDGQPTQSGFAPLSRFVPTADGWIRLHANYPWHRERLLHVLGADSEPDAVAEAAAEWQGEALEDAIHAAGGCAAAVRRPEEWQAHSQGAAIEALPLLEMTACGDAVPRRRSPGPLPASGVRVLDMTRVIAGPVCTRTLAAHGADVLRIDSPHLPEMPQHAIDSLVGKRSALLDLRQTDDREQFDGLLAAADVLVQGYRPGALERLGLNPEELLVRWPGLVVVSLSAWGHVGPWANRRGFDSLVQAASGIAVREATADAASGFEPGVLPAQLLDHATGYLAAAAALRALSLQHTLGRGWHIRLSLAQTAAWLLRQPLRPKTAAPPLNVDPYTVELSGLGGMIRLVRPPGQLGDRSLEWPSPPPEYGSDSPTWR
jgi:crotonobetainyl-CoA:carnitine CoA-transferase CaiB-like acyl-CoA transferase